MANGASLGGHVHIHDWAILGGFTIVHQFCHIGAHSFCAMGTVLTMDIPPYVTVAGHPAKPSGVNAEGLRRRGFNNDTVQAIKRGYKLLYKSQMKLEEAVLAIRELEEGCPEVGLMAEFAAASNRGIVR